MILCFNIKIVKRLINVRIISCVWHILCLLTDASHLESVIFFLLFAQKSIEKLDEYILLISWAW